MSAPRITIPGTAGGGVPVGGSGATGYVAKWTAATTLGGSATSGANASLFIDGSGNVGIGTASPTKKLDVNGAANITGALTVAGSVSRISGQQMFVPNGSFTVVTIPQNYRACLVSSTTTGNETLSSLHLIGSDVNTCNVVALSIFQTTVINHGATPGLAQIQIINNSGITATVKFSILQIS